MVLRRIRELIDSIYRWRSPEARCRHYKRQAERAIDRYLRMKGVDTSPPQLWAGPQWGTDDG